MIVAEGFRGTVRLYGEFEHTRFLPRVSYTVEMRSTFINASGRRKAPLVTDCVADDGGSLTVPFEPDMAGEWSFIVSSEDDKRKHTPVTVVAFVQSPALFGLRPYIGELHSHSTRSDGTQTPAYPPSRARTFGYDFFALTDHWFYDSSNEMISDIGDTLGKRMLLLNGEEFHPEKELLRTPVKDQPHAHHYHYTAIGHRSGVREAFQAGGESSEAEVETIASELRERGVGAMVDVRPYAEGVWKIRKVHELGGIAIFPHPYWATPINLDAGAIEQILADREVDAVEIFTTVDHSSFMQNRWRNADGEPLPAVGVTDSHNWNSETPDLSFTLVMAEQLTKEAVLGGIKAGRSVACRIRNPDLLVGPFELIPFATFYLDHVLPMRRRVMALQGYLSLSRLRGGAFSQDFTDALDDELDALDTSIWEGARG